MNWEYLRADEFGKAIEVSKGVCVLPLGCLEKHGPHLPVGCDSLKAKGLAEEAAALEEVMVFPSGMWLGEECVNKSVQNPWEKNMGGYVCINPKVLVAVLEELCDEIARNGFKKILILNSHGGNTRMLNYFMRTQAFRQVDYATMWAPIRDPSIYLPKNMYRIVMERIDEFYYLTPEDLEAMRIVAERGSNAEHPEDQGGHADWTETCLVYGYYPELVCDERMDAESGISTHRGDYLIDNGITATHHWYCNYPNAIQGYPSTGCSKNIGKAMRKLCVERLVKIFKLLKEDEDCIRMVQGLPKL
ncbi:MAG: creatininase family protein [Oscillospiraceae bacterium]|nr:creatininase family protein [Oscillospiraceae bacterium]